MKFFDIVRMCMRNLTKRKMRTLLTVTGVVIGTCAIIVMMSLGTGMDAAQKQMISEWADLTLINVYDYGNGSGGGGGGIMMGGSSSSGGPNGGSGKAEPMTDDVVKKIAEMDHVKAATPFYSDLQSGSAIAIYSDDYVLNWSPFVGVYMDQLEDFGYKLKEGRYKNKTDKLNTVLFGTQTCANLYDYVNNEYPQPELDKEWKVVKTLLNPMKDKFSIIPLTKNTESWETDYSVINSPTAPNAEYMQDLNVVGVIEGNNRDYYTMSGVFIDIAFMKDFIKAYNELNPDSPMDEFKGQYREVKVRVDDIDKVNEVEKAIQKLGYDTFSDNQSRENMKQQTQMIQMMLGALAAVSLFVAALNITNTMIMSIIERTKEIGIMKVLGCDVPKIRLLFLGEAASIGFIGGVVGIVLSYLASFLLNTFFGSQLMQLLGGQGGMSLPEGTQISVIEPWLAGAALIFATVVGLVSGFYPANRSVKISALSAITHD